MNTYILRLLLFTFLITAGSTFAYSQTDSVKANPNIVLILVDDSGLMDFGAFGGVEFPQKTRQVA